VTARSFREIVGLINAPAWRFLNTFSSNPLRNRGAVFPLVQVVPIKRIALDD
jgi:hypothetical protein